MVGHVQREVVGAQAADHRPTGRQYGAVLDEQRKGVQLVRGTRRVAATDTRQRQKGELRRRVRIGGVERPVHRQREARLPVVAPIPTGREVGFEARQLAGPRDFTAAAPHLLVVALQQRRRALHLAVLVDEGVGLQVVVVAQRVVVVERMGQPGGGAQPGLEDRAQPAHVLLVAAVDHVVVDVHRARIPAHLPQYRIGSVALQRRAPVGLGHALVLLLQRQGVAGVVAQRRAPGGGRLPRVAVAALRALRALRAVQVQPQHMAGAGRRAQAALQAQRQLALVAQAQPHLAQVALKVGDLGDQVDRAAHRARAVEEAGRPADRLHPVDQPGVDRAGRDRVVLHADAVVELRQAGRAEAAVEHRAGRTRLGREADAGDVDQRILAVDDEPGVQLGSGDHLHGGRRFTQRQAQARAAGRAFIELPGRGGGDLDALGCFGLRPGTAAGTGGSSGDEGAAVVTGCHGNGFQGGGVVFPACGAICGEWIRHVPMTRGAPWRRRALEWQGDGGGGLPGARVKTGIAAPIAPRS